MIPYDNYPLDQSQPAPAAHQVTAKITDQRGALVLLLGDTITLALFVYIGQRDHELLDATNPLGGVLAALAPFLVTWVVTAFTLGAFRVSAADMNWRTALGRWLNAWLIAAPMAVVLRALWLDRAVIPTNFLLAAFVFGGAMLLAWRVLFTLAWHRVKRHS